MAQKLSRRNFLKNSAIAISSFGLVNSIDMKETEAHPPYFNRPVYFGRIHSAPPFGRHPRNQFGYGFYTHSHSGRLHQGFLVQDLSLRMMLLGDYIRRQEREERIIRNSRTTIRPEDCRIKIERPKEVTQSFIANSYEDRNRNDTALSKNINFPEEFSGIGRTSFNKGELVTFGIWFPNVQKVKGLWTATRLYNEKGNLIDEYKMRLQHRDINSWSNMSFYRTKEGLDEGSYTAQFYIENPKTTTQETINMAFMNSLEFRVNPKNQQKDFSFEPKRKIVIEDLDLN